MGCCGGVSLRDSDPFFDGIIETDYFYEFQEAKNPWNHVNSANTSILMSYLFHVKTVKIDVLKRIIQQTTLDINHKNNNNFTAIHYAVCRDDACQEVIDVLVQAGADLYARAKNSANKEADCVMGMFF